MLFSPDAFPNWFYVDVPEGYSLVETKEHKLKRLNDEISEKETTLRYLEKRMSEVHAEIKSRRDELSSLDSHDGQ